jgi:prepilin-type N-terminal cleavage/methylation domain-containing protein
MFKHKKGKGRFGFTLVEIMIVVAIIVIIASLTIPGILRSRLNANEATAVTSLKTISWAAITYRTTNSAYPSNISQLGNAIPAYVDSVLSTGTKQGYIFNLIGDSSQFNVTAQPVAPNITGVRNFYVDTSGVIRVSSSGPADSSSSAL